MNGQRFEQRMKQGEGHTATNKMFMQCGGSV